MWKKTEHFWQEAKKMNAIDNDDNRNHLTPVHMKWCGIWFLFDYCFPPCLFITLIYLMHHQICVSVL